MSRASKLRSVSVPIWEPLILIVPKSAELDLTFPVVVTGPAISILVNPFTIEPTDKSPTVLIELAPAIGANCAWAVVVFILVASWSFTLVAPILLRLFNSAVLIFCPSSKLMSVASAVTVTNPRVREDAVRSPFTVNLSVSRASKLRSVLVPIWDPLILIVPKSAELDLTLPVVVTGPAISISVNPFTIEPTDKAPTVLIELAPAIGANCAWAVVVFILVASWSFTLVAPILLRLFNSAVLIFCPSSKLMSVASAVTVTNPRVREDAVRSPFTVNLSVSRASKLRSVLVPIWDPLILIVPKSAELDLTLPVVVTGPVISILVNPLIIDPTDKSPTTPNESLPVLRA